jgi:hypothetical protein
MTEASSTLMVIGGEGVGHETGHIFPKCAQPPACGQHAGTKAHVWVTRVTKLPPPNRLPPRLCGGLRPQIAAKVERVPVPLPDLRGCLSRPREREPPATDWTGAAGPLQTKRTGVGVTIRPRRRLGRWSAPSERRCKARCEEPAK